MIEMLHIDCMEYMATLPDKSFKLAIVDPPYGIGWDRENTTMSAGDRKDGSKRIMKSWKNPSAKNYKKGNWDSSIPTQDYFFELKRVSENQIVWGGNYFTEYLEPSGGWIVWDKGVPDGMSLSQAELAWNNVFNSVKITKHLWAGYKKCEVADRFHPTQKPVKLYRWLLHNYAKPGDRILDTHGGSRSLAIACHQMGFDHVSCELDKDYHEASVKRFKEQTKQLSLL